MNYVDYRNKAYTSNSILSVCKANGFDLSLTPLGAGEFYYDQSLPGSSISRTRYKLKDILLEAAYLYDLTMLKHLPYFLKKSVHNNNQWHLLKAVKTGYAKMNNGAFIQDPASSKSRDVSFINEMLSQARIMDGIKTFKFTHLFGMHVPLDLTEELKGTSMDYNRGNYKRQTKGLLKLTGFYLRKI